MTRYMYSLENGRSEYYTNLKNISRFVYTNQTVYDLKKLVGRSPKNILLHDMEAIPL